MDAPSVAVWHAVNDGKCRTESSQFPDYVRILKSRDRILKDIRIKEMR
jgi:hypothetical protein